MSIVLNRAEEILHRISKSVFISILDMHHLLLTSPAIDYWWVWITDMKGNYDLLYHFSCSLSHSTQVIVSWTEVTQVSHLMISYLKLSRFETITSTKTLISSNFVYICICSSNFHMLYEYNSQFCLHSREGITQGRSLEGHRFWLPHLSWGKCWWKVANI